MEQLGVSGEAIEVDPLGFQNTDRALGLQPQADPVHVVALEREHFLELLPAAPMGQFGAVQQHDA